jgi:glycosyltransferase involved in cell wall biosynthesis
VAHLRILAPAMARAGASVDVVCLDEHVARSFRAAGIDASVIPLRHKADVAGARRIRRLIGNVDVVHTQDRRAGLLIRPVARISGARSVHTYHGLPPELGVRLGREAAPVAASRARTVWLTQGYLRVEALLSRFGAVIVPSEALARFLRRHGFPAANLHVIPHGIDVDAARRPPRTSSDGPTVIGVASNLEHEKGVDVLIAAAALAERPLRLEILGDGACRERLGRLAAQHGVDARFAGHVEDVGRRIAGFEVFALPSRAENFPVAVLEAMAAGLPVVAARVGGVPELVVDGETGVVVEPENPTALAAALDTLAADGAARSALGAAGARRVAEHFGADRMAARTLALYESIA